MEEKINEITEKAYEILAYLPYSEPLKERAKDKVLAILENYKLFFNPQGKGFFSKEKIRTQLLHDITILLDYLNIAKSQFWVNTMNYLILAKEYEALKERVQSVKKPSLIEEEKGEKKAITKKKELSQSFPERLNERQEKILEYLKTKEGQVADFQKLIPKVTKRTLRRDLGVLLEIGKIERVGNYNKVFYRLKG